MFPSCPPYRFLLWPKAPKVGWGPYWGTQGAAISLERDSPSENSGWAQGHSVLWRGCSALTLCCEGVTVTTVSFFFFFFLSFCHFLGCSRGTWRIPG